MYLTLRVCRRLTPRRNRSVAGRRLDTGAEIAELQLLAQIHEKRARGTAVNVVRGAGGEPVRTGKPLKRPDGRRAGGPPVRCGPNHSR
jgi:hypothetical protein